ncbi:hypothetical protein [Chitinophaga sp.]|uniref:hypothetical protein n=1 Tax=Chitinophaga sp. TaxID=1869181 RepID=UPI0031E45A11
MKTSVYEPKIKIYAKHAGDNTHPALQRPKKLAVIVVPLFNVKRARDITHPSSQPQRRQAVNSLPASTSKELKTRHQE